jgi:hypothetical protein
MSCHGTAAKKKEKKVYACTLQQKRYVLSEDSLQAKNKKQDCRVMSMCFLMFTVFLDSLIEIFSYLNIEIWAKIISIVYSGHC